VTRQAFDRKVHLIYKELATKYDLRTTHFVKTKRIAVEKSLMKRGDRIVVFCCGSGMDFPFIQERIGAEGFITGIDFSGEMLAIAEERCKKNGWTNINLLQQDVSKFIPAKWLANLCDFGICTLGLSLIPNWEKAYRNLCESVRPGGGVIVADMQLARGLLGVFNPISVLLSKPFGGTWQGHKNANLVFNLMKQELSNLKKEEYFAGSYFIAWGNT